MTTITLTASEARENLYQLIKKASLGLQAFEIKLRGSEPVVLMSKADLESWEETLDVMNSPEEVKAITKGLKTNKRISNEEMKKLLGI